ncbi:hypothetical protein TIFTF001_037008 [Ficus carica]|uniref:Uncharacterized protein n=1 Tax=Ficus carica TaxID=3494 RepID=A0AA88E4H8_FICCA|nr:hypothetical protein TIFTF001_037008 [Ficus carica]
MYPRQKRQVIGEMKNTDRYWQDQYFFMLVNEKLMGKELRKPPLKALLFETKLERLLAQPNREWDEINVPNRVGLRHNEDRFSLPEGITSKEKGGDKDCKGGSCSEGSPGRLSTRASTVTLHRIILGAFECAGAAPYQKQRVDEKPKRKTRATKKETAKAIIPETNVEPQLTEEEEVNVENLPPGMSLLQNKKLGLQIMCQLLTGINMVTVNEGRIQSHLDVLKLKVIDKERGEKQLETERKFKDVRASINGLIAELCTLNQIAKEGAEMMKAMVDRFNKVKA